MFESNRSHTSPLHPQSCTTPQSARQRPSWTCGAPPALESRSSATPSSRSSSRSSRRTASGKAATRPRRTVPAHESDGRHVKRRPEGMRGTTGHMGTMWCSPLHCIAASQLVSWRLKKSLPCFHRSSQPSLSLQLQARGGSAGARTFQRARSSRVV